MSVINNNKISLFDLVVNQDLCIGCGICALVEPKIRMDWNKYGFLTAKTEDEVLSPKALAVCPFNPYPEESVRTENELAELFLHATPFKKEKIGRYINIYVGYSKQYRSSSSSGGIATYILTELLSRGIVNHVVSVKVSSEGHDHYVYAISSTKEDLIQSSQTKYYPVTFTETLQKVQRLDGKIAVTGVGCFVKAIRLLQHQDNYWKEKIAFVTGIICGGVKSRFFAEYLASKVGATNNEYSHPEFRIKDYNSSASDYSYACKDKNGIRRTIKMKSVGDMWGTGLFKHNACDFCDDVTTELADISLGDAWLSPYVQDGKGTNVFVTRSQLADMLIQEGLKNGDIQVEELTLDRFLSSQQGSFNHRHAGLKYRIKKAKEQGVITPPKRYDRENINFILKSVQRQRMQVRKLSLEIWLKTKDSTLFDDLMCQSLNKLRKTTMLTHYLRTIKRRIGL